MAALVCDICGGKLMMGAGGIAVCDSCGMEHSADRMKEKVQEIKGTVVVDNSHMIGNYLEMAKMALDAGNNIEAEAYCNKAIELSPTNYKALMLKGEAVAWQSTLKNPRIDEAIAAFAKGINNAPDEEKRVLIEHAKEQIKKFSVALIALRLERFAKWPDKDEGSALFQEIDSVYYIVLNFLNQTGALVPINEIMAPIATKMNQSAVQAWQNVVWSDYNGKPNDPDDKPDKYKWRKFIDRTGYCVALIVRAIELCDEDDEADIQRYENLIFMRKAVIDSYAWDYTLDYGRKVWRKTYGLSADAKSFHHKEISEHEAKIRAIKAAKAAKEATAKAEKERLAREEAQKRINEYWAEHIEEKKGLETELENLKSQINSLNAGLNDQIAELNKEIATIPGGTEIADLDERIKKLASDKNALGLFKGKVKKALQEQIDQLEIEKNTIQTRMVSAKKELEAEISVAKAEGQKKIAPLQNRINTINSELTKAR